MPNINKRPEKDCPTCGKRFLCVRPSQKYCSRDCIQGKGRTHLVCPCGTVTGSYIKKYCCPEHHEKYKKRKPPPRMDQHICVGCGEGFERPHFYPGKKKYCSNKCSHKQVKSVRDKFISDLPEGAVVFHSGWEIRFWSVCLRFDIPIRSYDGPDIQTSAGVYRPDFIIDTLVGERIVEVKGLIRPESDVKMQESKDSGHKLWVIDEDTLLALEDGDLSPLLDT